MRHARQHVVDSVAVIGRDARRVAARAARTHRSRRRTAPAPAASTAALRSPTRRAGVASPKASTVACAWSRRSPEPMWLKWAVPTARPSIVGRAAGSAARGCGRAHRRSGCRPPDARRRPARRAHRTAACGQGDRARHRRGAAAPGARCRRGRRRGPRRPRTTSNVRTAREADLASRAAGRGRRRCRPGRRRARASATSWSAMRSASSPDRKAPIARRRSASMRRHHRSGKGPGPMAARMFQLTTRQRRRHYLTEPASRPCTK